MASLDEGSVGIKLLAGLPDGNGLPAIAGDLLDDPRDVYAITRYRVKYERTDIENDSHTVILKLQEIEPVSGEQETVIRELLDKLRETRTGAVRLPGLGLDGPEVPAVNGKALKGATGPEEWTDAEVAALKQAEAEAAAQEAADDAADARAEATKAAAPGFTADPPSTEAEKATQPAVAPPFAEPTSLADKRKKA